eukprot:5434491-Pyramimonas_sp.AAC.2
MTTSWRRDQLRARTKMCKIKGADYSVMTAGRFVQKRILRWVIIPPPVVLALTGMLLISVVLYTG